MITPEHRTPSLHRFYRKYLREANTAAFIKTVCERYTSGTLARLAANGSRISRRAAVMALGFVGGYDCNAVVGEALSDRDRGVRLIADTAIRQIWCRAGNEVQRQRLTAIVRLNSTHQYLEALLRASQLIAQAPWYAEAWNQRAIAHYGLQRYAESIRDCCRTLELNPYHFIAAAGMGHCHLEQNDSVAALESFHRALRINPDMESVRAQAVRVERSLRRD